MKCILHIGTEKTGTTTLQSFLDINRDLLLKQGFLYTRSAGIRNNRYLSVAAYDPARRDDFTKSMGLFTDEQLKAFQKKTVLALQNELNRKIRPGKEVTVIFSNEHIQSRLRDQEAIIRLKGVLMDLGMTEISVVVYLRNPPDIANSLFSTAIKFGHTWKMPPPPEDPSFENICNHANTIKKFQAVFGESAVIPRLYDKKDLVKQSIIQDFAEVVGLKLDDAFTMPTTKNKSLSALGIELLRRINQDVPRFINNQNNPLRQDIVDYFEKHFSDSQYIMPPELYLNYQAYFQESNEWVRQKYFPGREELFPQKQMAKHEVLAGNASEYDHIAAAIADIWNTKNKQVYFSEHQSFLKWLGTYSKTTLKKAYLKYKKQ